MLLLTSPRLASPRLASPRLAWPGPVACGTCVDNPGAEPGLRADANLPVNRLLRRVKAQQPGSADADTLQTVWRWSDGGAKPYGQPERQKNPAEAGLLDRRGRSA